jgi:glycosyltransferase involved in cell wall biosynthesis
MAACDIVAHTSTEPEPFGRVIVEGQLAKRPVVASAAGGAMELIQDGVTGRLFPSGDVHALAGMIKELLAQPEQAIALGQQAYTSAKANFSLETIIASFEQALSAICIK